MIALDTLAFTVFLFLVGRLGGVALAASSIAFTLNLITFLPAVGLGQAVAVLVGQRLGEDRPDLAERSTWTGMRFMLVYMTVAGLPYVVLPDALALLFESHQEPRKWAAVAEMVPLLLRFVAFYSLFDGMNLIFSSALRGAGDTRFVTKVAVALAWPVMVLPTWAAEYYGWGIFWAWGFASSYIILLACAFLARFRQGKWRTMRVIETARGRPASEGCRPSDNSVPESSGSPLAVS
jgi:MATE family multidrug resistance protein